MHGRRIVPLSKEERRVIEQSFITELEEEHGKRESRARRRQRRRSISRAFSDAQHEKEVGRYKSELRRQFYEERGYELAKDRTGREMWLSPSELENQRRKQRGKRSRRKFSPIFTSNKTPWLLYVLSIFAAIIAGLFIAR